MWHGHLLLVIWSVSTSFLLHRHAAASSSSSPPLSCAGSDRTMERLRLKRQLEWMNAQRKKRDGSARRPFFFTKRMHSHAMYDECAHYLHLSPLSRKVRGKNWRAAGRDAIWKNNTLRGEEILDYKECSEIVITFTGQRVQGKQWLMKINDSPPLATDAVHCVCAPRLLHLLSLLLCHHCISRALRLINNCKSEMNRHRHSRAHCTKAISKVRAFIEWCEKKKICNTIRQTVIDVWPWDVTSTLYSIFLALCDLFSDKSSSSS